MNDLQVTLVAVRRTMRDAAETHGRGSHKTAGLLAAIAREQAETLAHDLSGCVVVGPVIHTFGFEVNVACLRNDLTAACSGPTEASLPEKLKSAMTSSGRALEILDSLAVHEFPAAP